MSKIAVVTDSNSGITQAEAKKMGVWVIPTPFFVNGKLRLEDVDLSHEQFFELLEEGAEVSTSQPAPGDVTDLWEELLKDHDEIVHIPISSGLSTSCEMATAIARDYDGKVQVVNNQRVSITQKRSVEDALFLASQGFSAAQIRERLEEEKSNNSIYLELETLKYLKKGGRITPAAAALGTLLNLKPVLQIQGDKLDAYAKARGKQKAKKIMIEAVREDMRKRFASCVEDGSLRIDAAYAGNPEEAKEWLAMLQTEFPEYEIRMDALSLSVSCHVGSGILAIGCSKKIL